MHRRLYLTLLLTLLLWGGTVHAFSFCSSFGGRDEYRSRYDDRLPPLPGTRRGWYWDYPYDSAPAYPDYNGNYPDYGGYYPDYDVYDPVAPADIQIPDPVPVAPVSGTIAH